MKKLLLLTMALGLLVMLNFTSICFAQADKSIYRPPEKKVIDTKFLEVSTFLVASTIFDVETTFAAIKKSGGHEGNPLVRPFIERGRLPTYAVQFGLDAVFLFIAYEIKKSDNPRIQRTWWVLPSIAATGHTVADGLNCRYIW